jgi:hypothetical protein
MLLILGYAWGRENELLKTNNHGWLDIINLWSFLEGMSSYGHENNGS